METCKCKMESVQDGDLPSGLNRELVTSAFEMFDVDGTGSIDVKEFGALLRAMGLPIDDNEAQDLVNQVDSDMSGEVEIEEFMKLMTLIDGSSTKLSRAEQTFTLLDKDKDGYITQEDIAVALDCIAAKYTRIELQAMFEQLDVDGGGTFDKSEFIGAFHKPAVHPWQEVKELSRKMRAVEAAWRMLDKDDDGSVTIDELTETLRRFADDDEISEMVRVADVDGDGEVSYHEFVKVFQHPAWAKASMMGKVAAQFEVLSKRQDTMYKLKQRREAAETGGFFKQGKETLMLRNTMKRNLKVQVAISKLWYTLGTLLKDGLWLNYAYASLHTRLSEFMGDEDPSPEELME